MSILEVSGLRKVYTTRFGGSRVEALHNVEFTVEQGEYVAIMGESGSGKTTLLNILAALDTPTAGTVRLDGRDLSAVKEADAAAFRRDHLGFVFQESTCWIPSRWRTTSICRWCWRAARTARCVTACVLWRTSWASRTC